MWLASPIYRASPQPLPRHDKRRTWLESTFYPRLTVLMTAAQFKYLANRDPLVTSSEAGASQNRHRSQTELMRLMLSLTGQYRYCTESGIVVETVTVPLVAITVKV